MESTYLAHWMSSDVIPASPFRKKAVLVCTDGSLMMLSRIGFHACVWIFAVKTVKDTQCGFKVPQSLHLLSSPFLLHNFVLNKISQFSFSCWREKPQRFFSTLFTSRDGLLMWRCWRWVSWIYALKPFLCLFALLWFQGCGNAADSTGWSFSKMARDWWLQTQPLASCYRDVQVEKIVLKWKKEKNIEYFLSSQGYLLAVVEICYRSMENPWEESMNIEGLWFQEFLMFDQQISLEYGSIHSSRRTAFEPFLLK